MMNEEKRSPGSAVLERPIGDREPGGGFVLLAAPPGKAGEAVHDDQSGIGFHQGINHRLPRRGGDIGHRPFQEIGCHDERPHAHTEAPLCPRRDAPMIDAPIPQEFLHPGLG